MLITNRFTTQGASLILIHAEDASPVAVRLSSEKRRSRRRRAVSTFSARLDLSKNIFAGEETL
jgi:hypothetical protein